MVKNVCFCMIVSFCPRKDLLKTLKKICIFIESHHRLIGKFSAYHGEFYFLRHWKIVPGLQCVELCETFISANNDAISKCKFHLMDPTFFSNQTFSPSAVHRTSIFQANHLYSCLRKSIWTCYTSALVRLNGSLTAFRLGRKRICLSFVDL